MGDGMQVPPMDEHNRRLVQQVHPPDWANPRPNGRYNLVVVGAGTGGLVTAMGAASLGARVALIERHLLGGDCLNVGCVPSKCLIRSARAAAEARSAAQLGVHCTGVGVEFGAVMERMRRLRGEISTHDSVTRFRDAGVDVYLGEARFTDRSALEVDGQQLEFHKAVIATGARAAAPPIPGLAEAGYYTNEDIFTLTELPERLLVLGGGPIGCELAQAFRRFGSEVTLVNRPNRLLPRDDAEAAEVIRQVFVEEGIRLRLGATVTRVSASGSNVRAVVTGDDGEREEAFDAILVAAGRVPNVAGLGLDAAGVQFDPKSGVAVDDYLRTSNPRVYAVGDAALGHKFTHAADAAARLVVENALFFRRKRWRDVTVPWCTYTDPEVAHVGLHADEAARRGMAADTFVQPLRDVDRAVTDGQTRGFLKVHVKRRGGRVLGATLVGAHAGETISEITTAMVSGMKLAGLGAVVHPYPTQSEAVRRVADLYNRRRLTPWLRHLLARWFAWRR